MGQLLIILCLAFPYCDAGPAGSPGLGFKSPVALPVRFELCFPERPSCLRHAERQGSPHARAKNSHEIMMAMRRRGKAMSGRPGTFLNWMRKRYPIAWSNLLTVSSGVVFARLIRDINALLADRLSRSVMASARQREANSGAHLGSQGAIRRLMHRQSLIGDTSHQEPGNYQRGIARELREPRRCHQPGWVTASTRMTIAFASASECRRITVCTAAPASSSLSSSMNALVCPTPR